MPVQRVRCLFLFRLEFAIDDRKPADGRRDDGRRTPADQRAPDFTLWHVVLSHFARFTSSVILIFGVRLSWFCVIGRPSPVALPLFCESETFHNGKRQSSRSVGTNHPGPTAPLKIGQCAFGR